MSDAEVGRRLFDRIFAMPEPPVGNVRAKLEIELSHLRELLDPAMLAARIQRVEAALAMMGPRQ